MGGGRAGPGPPGRLLSAAGAGCPPLSVLPDRRKFGRTTQKGFMKKASGHTFELFLPTKGQKGAEHFLSLFGGQSLFKAMYRYKIKMSIFCKQF